MSRDKGNRAPFWVAKYLQAWFPSAEKTPNGIRGTDITGTPGIAWEVKTGTEWRNTWMAQARRYATGGMPSILIYIPPGMGEAGVMHAQAVVPLHMMMQLLTEAGYATRAEPPEKDTA